MLKKSYRSLGLEHFFDESDAAGLVAWGKISSTFIPGFQLEELLCDYVLGLVGSRFGRVLRVDALSDGLTGPAVFVFYFIKPDASECRSELGECSESGEVVGTVEVGAPSFRVVEVSVNADAVSPEEFVQVVKTLSSVVYSVLLALLDTLPNSPACVKSKRCLEYVEELWKVFDRTFARVGLYPPVDLEVYERVKDVVERVALPFSSRVVVSEEDFRRVSTAFQQLQTSAKEEGATLFWPGVEEEQHIENLVMVVELGNGLTAVVRSVVEPSAWYSLRLRINNSFVEARILHSVYSGTSAYYLSVGAYTGDQPPKAEEAVEVFGNWFEYVRRALEGLVERFTRRRDLPPRTVGALVGYFRTWLDVLEKHRSELEKNRVVV